MASIKQAFGTSTSVTVTLASLADSASAGRESTMIDNATDLFLDVLIAAKFKTQNSGSISDPKCVYVWAYGSADDGTTYGDTVTGSDAAVTLNGPPNNLRLVGVVNVAAINTTYKGGPWSLAAAFGGRVPKKWGIVVQNDCGTALSSTEGDHDVWYQGLYATVA